MLPLVPVGMSALILAVATLANTDAQAAHRFLRLTLRLAVRAQGRRGAAAPPAPLSLAPRGARQPPLTPPGTAPARQAHKVHAFTNLARTDQCEPQRSGRGSKAATAGAQHGQLQVEGTEMRASSGNRTSSDKAPTSSRPPPPAAPCTKLCRPLKQPGSARQMMVTCTGRTG